jgi:transcriptional regulator with XRE-family HTH domain
MSEWGPDNWREWGASVKRRRVLAGWSRDDLERESGVSAETVRTIEDGDRGRFRPRRLATYREIEAALSGASPMPASNGDRLDQVLTDQADIRAVLAEQEADRHRVGTELVDALSTLSRSVDAMSRKLGRDGRKQPAAGR